MTGINAEVKMTTPTSDEERKALSFLGNPWEARYFRNPWEYPCTQTLPFYLNGNGASPESLMSGLLRLPQQIRYQIYELVILDNPPNHSPAYWLDTRGYVMCPVLSIEDGPFPTLECKAGYHGDYTASNFCHIQGFAEVLNLLQIDGLDSAGNILEDFLTFFGERTVVEMNNIKRRRPNYENKAERSLLWIQSLEAYHKYFQHLSLDFVAEGSLCCDPNCDHTAEDDFCCCDCYDRSCHACSTYCVAQFLELCEYIAVHLPNLKSAIFWIQLTNNELNDASLRPGSQPWIHAIKSLGIRKFEVKLLMINNKFLIPRDRDSWWSDDNPLWFTKEREERLLKNCLTPGNPIWSLTEDFEDDLGIGRLFWEKRGSGIRRLPGEEETDDERELE